MSQAAVASFFSYSYSKIEAFIVCIVSRRPFLVLVSHRASGAGRWKKSYSRSLPFGYRMMHRRRRPGAASPPSPTALSRTACPTVNDVVVVVFVVVLTLNRSFYRTTSAVHPASVLILYPREIQIMWSQTVRPRIKCESSIFAAPKEQQPLPSRCNTVTPDRPRLKKEEKKLHPALVQREMLPTVHQRAYVDDSSYGYPAARVSS